MCSSGLLRIDTKMRLNTSTKFLFEEMTMQKYREAAGGLRQSPDHNTNLNLPKEEDKQESWLEVSLTIMQQLSGN